MSLENPTKRKIQLRHGIGPHSTTGIVNCVRKDHNASIAPLITNSGGRSDETSCRNRTKVEPFEQAQLAIWLVLFVRATGYAGAFVSRHDGYEDAGATVHDSRTTRCVGSTTLTGSESGVS